MAIQRWFASTLISPGIRANWQLLPIGECMIYFSHLQLLPVASRDKCSSRIWIPLSFVHDSLPFGEMTCDCMILRGVRYLRLYTLIEWHFPTSRKGLDFTPMRWMGIRVVFQRNGVWPLCRSARARCGYGLSWVAVGGISRARIMQDDTTTVTRKTRQLIGLQLRLLALSFSYLPRQ
ncbi:hypothetical protein BDQ17DRAFT_548926 [Cyathus striatus]|nr:hypothetical protein BDQ17DRAFT_548926 [Cyathus striatus]